MSTYLLGVDVGTHSTKGVLFEDFSDLSDSWVRVVERTIDEMHVLACLGTSTPIRR